jgi:phage/conjugal plasmid C-4 type zinc finger TraR family protein
VDDADCAAIAADKHLQKALAAARPDPGRFPSRRFCEDCEELIPEARRTASPGCTRCINCQALFEKENS